MVMFPDLLAVAAAAAFSSASLWAATRFRRASNLASGPPLQGAANCSGLTGSRAAGYCLHGLGASSHASAQAHLTLGRVRI